MRPRNAVIAITLLGSWLLTTGGAGAAEQAAPPAKPSPAPTKPAPATAKAKAKPKWKGPRFTLTLFGTFTPGSVDLATSRTFEEFTEDGSFHAEHSFESGIGGELGLQYLIKPKLGVGGTFSIQSRDGSATYEADFPHPLLLDTPREVSGTVDGLSYKETAIHLDIVYTETKGAWTYALFAGPTFFTNVEADVLEVPEYSHSYPFDTVTVTSVPVDPASGSAFGFNVGGELGLRLAKSVDAGVRARFSRATTDLPLSEGGSVEVSAGGFTVGVGVRIRF